MGGTSPTASPRSSSGVRAAARGHHVVRQGIGTRAVQPGAIVQAEAGDTHRAEPADGTSARARGARLTHHPRQKGTQCRDTADYSDHRASTAGPRGRSPMRASEAGAPAGGPHLQPDQRRVSAASAHTPLSFEQLAAIHGGIGGIREKVHLPLYDASLAPHCSMAKAIRLAAW